VAAVLQRLLADANAAAAAVPADGRYESARAAKLGRLRGLNQDAFLLLAPDCSQRGARTDAH